MSPPPSAPAPAPSSSPSHHLTPQNPDLLPLLLQTLHTLHLPLTAQQLLQETNQPETPYAQNAKDLRERVGGGRWGEVEEWMEEFTMARTMGSAQGSSGGVMGSGQGSSGGVMGSVDGGEGIKGNKTYL